jgi:beta-glucosidase
MAYTRRFFLASFLAASLVARARAALAQTGGSPTFAALQSPETLTPAQADTAARDLLSKLTLDEKIGLMSGDAPFFRGFLKLAAGGYNRPPLLTAGAIPRLAIPGMHFTDGPRGVVLPGATTFPVSMARGASFDPALEERVGDAMGREARAYGADIIGAPCINLLRHPGWGRAQETYGEDSHHLGEMGAALTRGIQRHVMSCVKHFALNSIENGRFIVDVSADARTLHEVYLPHFKRVIDAGVASVMSSYNSVNGEWAGQNRVLLHDILVRDWGFTGFVQTDWIWGLRDAKKGALAGQQLEMPFQNQFHRFLPGLVRRGEVAAAVVEDASLRILRQRIRFGSGRNPGDYKPDVIGCEAHRRLAREAAQKASCCSRMRVASCH